MRIIKNILLFSITLALGMFILDRYIQYAEIVTLYPYDYDPKIGVIFRPGIEYSESSEGYAIGKINSSGFIGNEYDVNSKKLKIALYGDSFVEGFQVLRHNHFMSVLARELKEKYNIDAEIMNFGRAGFEIEDMYSYTVNYGSKFKPDISLYFICNEDFNYEENTNELPYPFIENDSIKIFYYKTPVDKPWYLSIYKMSQHSAVAHIIKRCIGLYNNGDTPRILFGKFYPVKPQSETEIVQESIKATPLQKKIIENFVSSGDKIIVDRQENGLNKYISELINASGIPRINLTDTLSVLKQKGINPYINKHGSNGHWNNTSHNLIGVFLAEKINEYLKQKKLK